MYQVETEIVRHVAAANGKPAMDKVINDKGTEVTQAIVSAGTAAWAESEEGPNLVLASDGITGMSVYIDDAAYEEDTPLWHGGATACDILLQGIAIGIPMKKRSVSKKPNTRFGEKAAATVRLRASLPENMVGAFDTMAGVQGATIERLTALALELGGSVE